MKQIAIFTIGALTFYMLAGIMFLADTQEAKSNRESIHAPMDPDTPSYYHTMVIDSCEYIDAPYKLVHKGNCRFCAERKRKETD